MSNKINNSIWLLLTLFAVFLVSCAAPTIDSSAADAPMPSRTLAQTQELEGSKDMINPGDMIGEMVFRKAADESEARPFLAELCGWTELALAELSEDKTVECIVAYEPAIFLGYGMEEPDLDKRSESWGNMTWEVSINGRPLDLEAFGTIDTLGGRWWNVLLENPASDRFQIVTVVTVHEEPEEPIEMYGNTLELTVGAAD